MATPKSIDALEKSKEAASAIKERLVPVLQRLADDNFGEETGRACASVALSIGMMRYMGARLRGLDQGRKSNDPLRKDLNNIKRVLANTMKAQKGTKKTTESSKETAPDNHESKSTKTPKNENETMKMEKEVVKKEGERKKTNINNKKNKRKSGDVKSPGCASKKAREKK